MALPRFIPARSTAVLTEALSLIGAVLGPIKPGTRLTHTLDHAGVTWELTYMGPMGGDPVWRLSGPGVEQGIAVIADEAVEHIAAAAAAAAVPEPQPEPDPYPRAPRTHAGVPVPELVRSQWGSVLSDGWCLGVWSTKAAVAGA